MQLDTSSPNPASPEEAFGDVAQLKRYFNAIRRRWPVILTLTLVGAFLGFITTPDTNLDLESGTKYYRATNTIVASGTVLPMPQVAFLATTGLVPERVAEKLGIPVAEVQRNVLAFSRPDVLSVEITAISTRATTAEEMANTTASELQAFLTDLAVETYTNELNTSTSRRDSLEAEIVQIADDLADAEEGSSEHTILQNELRAVSNTHQAELQRFTELVDQGQPNAGINSIESASRIRISEDTYTAIEDQIEAGPDAEVDPELTAEIQEPSGPPSAVTRTIMGLLFGLGIGIASVLVLDRYDTRLRRREEVEAVTGLPVLAEIPPLNRRQQRETDVLTYTRPRSPTAEAFRVIRTAILFAEQTDESLDIDPDKGRVIMVTSANPSEGKTTTVANLAAVMAESGQSVLVIDCDFRRPRIHRYLEELGMDPTAHPGQPIQGLGEHGRAHLDHTGIPNVKLVTGFGHGEEGDASEANPADIVALQQRVIEIARNHFDVVLLDTAPFLTTNDAADLLPVTDALLLVCRAGLTKSEAAQRAAEFLRRLEAPTLGVILTEADETPVTYYYYGYYLDSRTKRKKKDPAGRPLAEAESANGGNPDAAVGESNGSAKVPNPSPVARSAEGGDRETF